jgi:hypothetical protein
MLVAVEDNGRYRVPGLFDRAVGAFVWRLFRCMHAHVRTWEAAKIATVPMMDLRYQLQVHSH